jgi:hypothetical protein
MGRRPSTTYFGNAPQLYALQTHIFSSTFHLHQATLHEHTGLRIKRRQVNQLVEMPKDLAYYNGPVYRRFEAEMKSALPELELPPGWYIEVDPKNYQVYYYQPSKGTTSNAHPSRGYLPPDWCIRMCTEDDGRRRPSYYNTKTQKRTKDDPRLSVETLRERRRNWKDETTKAIGAVTRMKTGTKLEDLRRQPVKNTNFRNKYHRVHAIDGPEAKDSIGAMNGGVYVVKLKDDFSRLYIEKK